MTDSRNNSDQRKQHLTFSLAGEEYGVNILVVREIRGWSRVTVIPQTPNYVLGVLNLRGVMVPIMDLRCRFGLAPLDVADSAVTIVVAVAGNLFGIVVDAVSDVLDIDENDIKPVPRIGGDLDTAFLKGLSAFEDRMVLLLDVDKLLPPEFNTVGLIETALDRQAA